MLEAMARINKVKACRVNIFYPEIGFMINRYCSGQTPLAGTEIYTVTFAEG